MDFCLEARMARFLAALCSSQLFLTQCIIGGEVITPSGATWIDSKFGIEMVRIKAGTFMMGSAGMKEGGATDEVPEI